MNSTEIDRLLGQIKNHPPGLVKVRCPECYRKYSVKAEEIEEPQPRFECVSCHTQFWIAFPECLEASAGVIGFPVDGAHDKKQAKERTKEPSPLLAKPFSCPKCGEGYDAGDKECGSCGVIFGKLEMAQSKKETSSYFASQELKGLWESVLEQYEDYENHRNFLIRAQAELSLPYAESKYKNILELCPSDEIAIKAKKEINALIIAQMESQMRAPLFKSQELLGHLRIPRIHFGTIIMFMCGVVIAMGFVIPGMRNLIGVGSSMLFFILALRYYFRVI